MGNTKRVYPHAMFERSYYIIEMKKTPMLGFLRQLVGWIITDRYTHSYDFFSLESKKGAFILLCQLDCTRTSYRFSTVDLLHSKFGRHSCGKFEAEQYSNVVCFFFS